MKLTIERRELAVETLGRSLTEGKSLLAGVQDFVVRLAHYIAKVESSQGEQYVHAELRTAYPISSLKNEIVAGPCDTAELAWEEHHARRKAKN